MDIKTLEFQGKKELAVFLNSLSFSKMRFNIRLIHHIALLDSRSNRSFILARDISIQDIYSVLMKNNIFWKNYRFMENVYIYPSPSNAQYDFIFLDDFIDIELPFEYFMKVQTSKSKFQAYYRLKEPVTAQEAYNLQKAFQKVSEADPGAIGANQCRRIPGFINTKYSDMFMVKIVSSKEAQPIHARPILNKIALHEKQNNAPKNSDIEPKNDITQHKKYKDFIGETLSNQDIKYVHYLIRLGKSDDYIKDSLMYEADIANRKRNPDYYINLTIQKARAYQKNND